MAVEQKARRTAPGIASLAHHDRISVRGPDAGLETNTGEILCNVLCRIQALCLVGRISRNGLNAQEREEAIETLIKISIDLGKYGRERMRRCHASCLLLEQESGVPRISVRVFQLS